MRVFVDVNARADRDALRQVVGGSGHAHANQRLGIGAHVPANLVAEMRQRLLVLQLEEKLHGAQRGGGEDDAAAGEALADGGLAKPWTSRSNLVAAAAVLLRRRAVAHRPRAFPGKPSRRASRRDTDNSYRGCFSRHGGNPSCSRRNPRTWFAPDLRRRSTGRASVTPPCTPSGAWKMATLVR